MRIFFSVGEPSGDLHGSNLIRRLKSDEPSVECVGFGGPKMAEAGCDLHFELTTMAVMFLEALKSLRFFFRLVDQAEAYFKANKVDAVVLIDFPGFNWWIAKKAKKHGIPVFYYGVPQMWAWAPWRVRKIRKYVDHVLCKLPFEVEWFAKRKCKAIYVGHPFFDQLQSQEYDEAFMSQIMEQKQEGRKLLTLLPGSRDQEVRTVLPILLSSAANVVQQMEKCDIAIASFNVKQQEMAKQMLDERGLNFKTFVGKTPELMKQADVCLACSGSVSLELLHHRKPSVIVFKVKRWLMLIQPFLLRVKFITLVNLFATDDIRRTSWRPHDPDAPGAEEAVMPEYLTCGDPSAEVSSRVARLLTDESLRQKKIQQLDQLAREYAIPGASDRAANYILARTREFLSAESGDSSQLANNLVAETNKSSAA